MSFSPAQLQAVLGDLSEALREQGIGTVEVGEIVNLLDAAREAAPPR
jgi:ribosomal protein S28E/S33